MSTTTAPIWQTAARHHRPDPWKCAHAPGGHIDVGGRGSKGCNPPEARPPALKAIEQAVERVWPGRPELTGQAWPRRYAARSRTTQLSGPRKRWDEREYEKQGGCEPRPTDLEPPGSGAEEPDVEVEGAGWLGSNASQLRPSVTAYGAAQAVS
jgi:hypothetical protein